MPYELGEISFVVSVATEARTIKNLDKLSDDMSYEELLVERIEQLEKQVKELKAALDGREVDDFYRRLP